METKAFYKTTEFWGTVLVNLGAILAAMVEVFPAPYVPLVNALSVGFYAIARGLAKSGVEVKDQPATGQPTIPH